MQTAIKSSDYALTGALRSFIRGQIDKTMHASSSHIHKLTVRLKDLNGPKGGEDKECCIEIMLAEQAPVIVKKRSSNAYASIRNALDRASRITLRRLRKKRNDLRKPSALKSNEENSSEFEGQRNP